MAEIKLKPCPFCGGEAEFIEGKYPLPCFRVECGNKNCFIAPSTMYSYKKEEAADDWNRRHNED